MTLQARVSAIPKVELHLHLEGAISPATLFSLIQKHGGTPGVETVEDMNRYFSHSSFEHFIRNWCWARQWTKAYEDFEQLAYQVLSDLAKQNVRYVEAFFTPGDHELRGKNLKLAPLTEAILAGANRARRDHGIEYGFIVDLCRNFDLADCRRWLNEATPFLGQGVIGIGIGGMEEGFPPGPFQEIFSDARARGFHTTAHAGEGSGPRSIWGAIQELNVERIGHGVRCNEDERLMKYLIRERIPLELCPTSNVATRVVDEIGQHPIRQYFDAGMMVTVNSDDPTFFQCSMESEFQTLHEKLGFGLNELKQLSLNGIQASFMPEDQKSKYRASFAREMDGIQ